MNFCQRYESHYILKVAVRRRTLFKKSFCLTKWEENDGRTWEQWYTPSYTVDKVGSSQVKTVSVKWEFINHIKEGNENFSNVRNCTYV